MSPQPTKRFFKTKNRRGKTEFRHPAATELRRVYKPEAPPSNLRQKDAAKMFHVELKIFRVGQKQEIHQQIDKGKERRRTLVIFHRTPQQTENDERERL